MSVNFDEIGKQCWATAVRELLCKTGFYFVWLQQGVGDVNSFLYVFKQRLLDMFARSGLLTSETKKDEMYRSSKLCLEQENIYQL